jgi:hypothetical protein
LDEGARGEYDVPNRESGAHQHHHRQDFHPRNPLARTSAKKQGITHPAPPLPLSRHPTGVLQRGIDAPAARSSRTATSAATPSDQATCRAGPDSAARVTLQYIEAIKDYQHRLWHPPPWMPTSPPAAHKACVPTTTGAAAPPPPAPPSPLWTAVSGRAKSRPATAGSVQPRRAVPGASLDPAAGEATITAGKSRHQEESRREGPCYHHHCGYAASSSVLRRRRGGTRREGGRGRGWRCGVAARVA